MIVLPNEIVSQTLEELRNDAEALRSCLSVSKRFRDLTRRVLYADILIDLDGPDSYVRPRLERFREVLPLALPHIRILRVKFAPLNFVTRLFANVLLLSIRAHANLTELHLCGRYDRMRTNVIPQLIMLPSLRRLSLLACRNVPIAAFQERPALQFLELRHTSVAAPFDFDEFYSGNATYGFDHDLPLDSNGIKHLMSLRLHLGLPSNPAGDGVLLRGNAAHLTFLTLYFHSTMAEDYDSLAGLSLDHFPCLSSLSLLFEIAIDLRIPLDLIAFLRGNRGKTSLERLNVIFRHTAPYFPDLFNLFPYIMTCEPPFALDDAFSRNLSPQLTFATCFLRLSIYELYSFEEQDITRFEETVRGQFNAFFQRAPGSLEWLKVGVELQESFDPIWG